MTIQLPDDFLPRADKLKADQEKLRQLIEAPDPVRRAQLIKALADELLATDPARFDAINQKIGDALRNRSPNHAV
jgi:hypothetical protein